MQSTQTALPGVKPGLTVMLSQSELLYLAECRIRRAREESEASYCSLLVREAQQLLSAAEHHQPGPDQPRALVFGV